MQKADDLIQAIFERDAKQVHLLLEQLSTEDINHLHSVYSFSSSQGSSIWTHTAFFQACKMGNTSVIDAFLACDKVNYNQKSNDNHVPLFSLAYPSLYHCLEKMIEKPNVDIHAIDHGQENILHCLAKRSFKKEDNHSIEIFKRLILKGVDVHLINEKNESVLDLAILSKQSEIVKYLLSINMTQHYTIKSMYHAILIDSGNETNFAKQLINHGYDFHYFLEEGTHFEKLLISKTPEILQKVKETHDYFQSTIEKTQLELNVANHDKAYQEVKKVKQKI